MGVFICWLEQDSVQAIIKLRRKNYPPEVDIVIETAPGKPDHVADDGNRLRCQRWFARIVAEHSAGAIVGQSNNTNKYEIKT